MAGRVALGSASAAANRRLAPCSPARDVSRITKSHGACRLPVAAAALPVWAFVLRGLCFQPETEDSPAARASANQHPFWRRAASVPLSCCLVWQILLLGHRACIRCRFRNCRSQSLRTTGGDAVGSFSTGEAGATAGEATLMSWYRVRIVPRKPEWLVHMEKHAAKDRYFRGAKGSPRITQLSHCDAASWNNRRVSAGPVNDVFT